MSSKKARTFVSHKIGMLKKEGKTQEQAVAQALGMARQKGLKVQFKVHGRITKR